jgi:parvulin-like peptidyl-prolyl isomerase
MKFRLAFSALLLCLVVLSTGCRASPTSSPTGSPVPSEPPQTETALPLAALVNGESITLAEFEEELRRFADARGIDLATSQAQEIVIQAMIEQRLLAQAARSRGHDVNESMLDSKIEQLRSELGESNSFETWRQENHFTMSSFRASLKVEMLAAEMIDDIVSQVPKSELQVHGRHLLVASLEEAQSYLEQILAGADFGELASQYSLDLSTRPGGGDLGWFPRGTLTMQNVEDAFFLLQPGELGDIIESDLGFHIIELIEREQRPLTTSALTARREVAIEDFLENEMARAAVEIFLDTAQLNGDG